MRNFPYFTCLAAIFCCVGGGLFAGYIHAVADLTIKMLQDSMHITYPWMEGVEILCTALGCLMIFLSLLIFFSSFIVGTTASTPNNYVVGQDNDKRSKSRNVVRNPSSQAPSLIYTCLLAPALPIWFFLMGITIFFGLLSRILNGVCTTEEIQPLWSTSPAPQSEVCQTVLEGEDCVDCIDLYQFHFLFPASARKEDMWICGKEIVVLCATDMEHIIKYWTLAFVGSILVIAGIFVHFMNLSYTRTVLQKEKVIKEIEEDIFIKKKVALAMKAKKRHSRDPDFKAPLILHERP